MVGASEHQSNGTGGRAWHVSRETSDRVGTALAKRQVDLAGPVLGNVKQEVADELGVSVSCVGQALVRLRNERGITVPSGAHLRPAAPPPPATNGREPTPLPAAFEAQAAEPEAEQAATVADQAGADELLPECLTPMDFVAKREREAADPGHAYLAPQWNQQAQRVPLQPVFSLSPDLRSLALDLAAGKELGVDLQELSLADRAGVLGLAGRLVEVARAA